MSSKTATPTPVPDRELENHREPTGPSIRCPQCGCPPGKTDKWFCECGHSWNTFDTGGVRPLPASVD